MPSTARVHISQVDGYMLADNSVQPARCFALDPPALIEGVPRSHVLILLSARYGRQAPEVRLYPCTETGAIIGPQLHRRVGSFTLGSDAIGDLPYEEGCYFLALTLLGGYKIITADEPAPEPEPAP